MTPVIFALEIITLGQKQAASGIQAAIYIERRSSTLFLQPSFSYGMRKFKINFAQMTTEIKHKILKIATFQSQIFLAKD
jgi:hypothetical protein